MSAAYIPTPIYFGAVIDTTCMLWQQDCGIHGSCWEYDVTSFRFVYFGLAASLKFVGFVFIFLTWYSIKYKEDRLERWQRHLPPLGTVSELICHAGGHKSHARTHSCPVFTPRPEPPDQPPLNRGYCSQSCPGNTLKAITPPARSLQEMHIWGTCALTSASMCLPVRCPPPWQDSVRRVPVLLRVAFRGLLCSPISMSPVQTHSKYTLCSICSRSVWKTSHGAKWGTERTFLCHFSEKFPTKLNPGYQDYYIKYITQAQRDICTILWYYATLYHVKAPRLPLSTVWS